VDGGHPVEEYDA
jgi:hypothetical protein